MNDHDHTQDGQEESGEGNKLRYRIELWKKNGERQLLAKAATATRGRAIFKAAMEEHPTDRVTLGTDRRLFADSEAQRRWGSR